MAPTENPPKCGPKAGCLLVIDDEPMMLRAIERLLGSEYEVVSSTDPAAAVASVRAGARFDAIVCDMMMPMMSGVDVYDTIRALDPDQARRIVFMTGGAFSKLAVAFLESVDNPRVDKPVDRASLRDAIRAVGAV